MISKMMRSVIEQDRASVVLCDLDHTIVYMNPAAVLNYAKWGGAALVGQSLLNCHNPNSRETIEKIKAWFLEDVNHNIVHTFFNEKQQKDGYVVALRDEDNSLIGYYEKHEYRLRDEAPFYEMN